MPPRGIVSSLDWHRVVSSENCPTQRILILDFQKNTCVQYCHFDPKVQIQNLIFSLVSILIKFSFCGTNILWVVFGPPGSNHRDPRPNYYHIVIFYLHEIIYISYLYIIYPLLRIYHIYLTNITFICDKKNFIKIWSSPELTNITAMHF